MELPADLVSAAKLDRGDVSLETAKFIALELFREGTIALGTSGAYIDPKILENSLRLLNLPPL